MKRRIISAILAFALIIAVAPGYAYASNDLESTSDVIYLKDGSYFIISIDEFSARASGTKTGRKTYTYESSDGVVLWTAVQTASFSYTGSSATCTSASCSVTISNKAWYEKSNVTTRSGNTATTALTMGQKLLGIPISTYDYTFTLTCDANGNLS